MMLGSRPAARPLPRSRMQVFFAASQLTSRPDTLQTAVQKPLCDKRRYQHAQLQNGVRALLVQDKDAVYAAVCASIQAGYFDDPPSLPGAVHFLEHMVHLGSERFPDEKEYKAFLAQHGGSSNASTSMVHTKYHFKVHHSALQGALQRFGAMLSSPLIASDSAAREVENVHAEYSRNTNSDGRKLLQLRRSLCEPPYSNFSTGSLDTLWQQPTASGMDIPAMLKGLWKQFYKADATCVAVVGPQEPDVLLKWVEASVVDMPSRGKAHDRIVGSTQGDSSQTTSSAAGVSSYDSSSTSISTREVPASASASAPESEEVSAATADRWPAAVHRYPVDVVPGCRGPSTVYVSPQRDLRELEVSWYIPQGMLKHSSTKPWSWASHLLGYEGVGSVAHLLKAQGLVQNLSVGIGDEVRLARGWMFWRVQVSLTKAGEDALEHVLATIYRGVQLIQQCSDAELEATWQEAARLAELRFNWQDPTEPLACAQSTAYALHYYAPEATLSGCHLMTKFDPAVLRWFVKHLTPETMTVFYSSHRNKSIVNSKEQWYGAEYSVQPLPQAWLDSIAAYGAIALSRQHSTAALAHETFARSGNDPSHVCADGLEQSGLHATAQQPHQQGAHLEPLPGQIRLPEPNWALPQDLSLRRDSALSQTPIHTSSAASFTPAVYDGAPAPPQLLQESPGLCAWVKTDVSYGLPKVHLYLHLVTPLTYSSPEASVAMRLLLRVVEDLLLPITYPAELAGSHYDLSSEQGGLALKIVGFPGVAQKLLLMVLQGLLGITCQQVQERLATMSGRLVQNLTNWAKNNPQQHAEYAAHHLLQLHHHHNAELLQAAAAAAPDQLMSLQEQLATGRDLHIDMLAYGNISSQEAADLVVQLQQQLKPQGLPAGVWPPAGRVLCLSPVSNTGTQLFTAHKHGGQGEGSQQVQLTADPVDPTDDNGVTASCSSELLAASSCSSNVLVTYLPEDPNPSNSNSAIYYTIQIGPDSVRTAVLLDLFVQISSKAAFHELRTRQRLGYSVNLNSTSLHRQLGLMIRIQSPTTTPDALVSAVRAWLVGYRAEVQDAARQQLDNAKKALRDKYLDPPKSLREAARRAWTPVSTRSLAFDRRKQKACLADALDQQQLMDFYDTYVDPGGPSHQALCVHICGGSQQVPPDVLTAQVEGQATSSNLSGSSSSSIPRPGSSSNHVTVRPEGVDVFKRCQPLMPLPDFISPPPAE